MQHYPRGRRYTALEKNVLKLRAFEMVLILFRVQGLRRLVVESVRATKGVRRSLSDGVPRAAGRATVSESGAWRALVDDEILNAREVEEVKELVDYRSLIAHETERLTVEVNRDWSKRVDLIPDVSRYRPEALGKLDRIWKKVSDGLGKKYVISLSLTPLMFEPAERAYREEITRLRRKIRRQIREWNKEIEDVKGNVASLPDGLLAQLDPGHPTHEMRNGSLSAIGVDCCHALFAAGATPLSTAYLMRISLRAAKKRYAGWKARTA